MNYLIFGGTGSLGRTLVEALLQKGNVFVFARGEEKHHNLKRHFPRVNNIVGDIRDYDSVLRAIKLANPDVIIQAAAMKQVPLAEDYPWEAVLTNIVGTQNVVKALENFNAKQQIKVLSISTDKAAKPVNSYGMTKALQERIHLRAADLKDRHYVFNCVRYGNVLSSTGSVIPVFVQNMYQKKPLVITHPDMTRFLLSLDDAVKLIFTALEDMGGGKIFIPKVKSAKITDLAKCIMEVFGCGEMTEGSIRPGEKIHEILISEEECLRTQELNDKFVIHDIKQSSKFTNITKEFSSADYVMSYDELKAFLKERGVFDEI